MIITEEMIEGAIEMAKPSVEAIFAAEGCTWGPKWVSCFVRAPGLYEDVPFVLGEVTEWNPVWGEEMNFQSVAFSKLNVAARLKMTTSVAVATTPWLLEPGEWMYPGGVYRDGISVAVSGVKGRCDEAIAEMIISLVIMLAHLEADRLKERGDMQILDEGEWRSPE